MTEQTRRNVFRYGIAIDLVILATGIGMLLPVTAPLLIGAYAAAVALSVWRGGWQGGLTALVLSQIALLGAFPEVIGISQATTFTIISVILGGAVALATRQHPQRAGAEDTQATAVASEPELQRFDGPRAVPHAADDDSAHRPLEQALAEVVPLWGGGVPTVDQTPPAAPAGETTTARDESTRRPSNGSKRKKGRRNGAARREEEEVDARRREAEAARVRAETESAAAAKAEAERAAAQHQLEQAERLAIQQREEAERRAAEAELALKRAEADRAEAERAAALQREDAERRAAEAEAARERAEQERLRLERELEERVARERVAASRQSQEREEAERRAVEAEEQRRAAEQASARVQAELAERVARERESAERELRERMDAERLAGEQDLRRQLALEREAMRADGERELEAERRRMAEEVAARAAAASQGGPPEPSPASVPARAARASVAPPPREAPKTSLLETVSGWFKRGPRPRTVNLNTRRLPANGNTTATKRPQAAAPARRAVPATLKNSKPRLLMIERRRGTADTVVPRLRDKGVDIVVVERWVDAVDEIFRLKPHAVLLDTEHPEFEVMHRTLSEKSSRLPLILTARTIGGASMAVRHAAVVVRPYDADELLRLAQTAAARPEEMLATQMLPRSAAPAAAGRTASRGIPVAAAAEPSDEEAQTPSVNLPRSNDDYQVMCFTCRAPFDAMESDWCSCLAKERTLVCTNCLACFCKAPPSYKEKFWIEAPPRLFERKTVETRKQEASLPPNPPKEQVPRPLVLTVEDDDEIQAIVQRVCSNLGYGFIWANNGQDGMDLAREYRPNMILSDAFMPRLDGREMCRLLKEDPVHADTRMVVMTGLYTDTKYRSEAVKRFHVDDYVSKPVAITDLINLLQKHLEGVVGLPAPDDLHDMHRPEMDDSDAYGEDDVSLADVLAGETDSESQPKIPVARPRQDTYEVCCFNCQQQFEATRAEWCSCVGRDNTLVCEHCNGCFCKAPAAYRERFWIDAPPSLFERKMIGSKRNITARFNPTPADVKRPLILLVEDDENVQLIVKTVVSSMGYGFVVGANGQEGLSLAREYNPDLILSDAFMPKLDGREMCRLLKEDPVTARAKAIIMTGLYTDRKYRNEALDYFKVDDYVAKPLAVDDLIKLFKKHLTHEVATTH